ncbi:MAG: class II aldolase/adducin family protein, partial [Salinisphaera sp.]|uniref:class II aldolase/adducin family protein n=1 Tax=Salinisphaera sp. TaxID=1914330 RepID=UPI003C7999F9
MSQHNDAPDEAALREEIAAIGRAFRQLGVAPGTSGNISARLADGWLMTPTNASLGALDPDEISKLDWDGNLRSGKPPTKESFLHRA